MKWVEFLVAILSGLIVCIPLVSNLVLTVQEHVKEKNWNALLKMVMQYMVDAEGMYDVGVNRKAFVMANLEAMAKACNYDLTDESREKVSDMIDAMCDMAHIVNGDGEDDD